MHWPRIKKDSGTVERRKTSRPPMPLFLSCVGDIIPCRIELCFMALLVLCSITRSSWWSNSSGYSEWKIAFSNSNIEDNLTRPGKNFQSESILSVIWDDPLLDNRTRWIHEGTMRSWRHGVKVSGHHDGYWVGFADTRVLLVWNGYRQVLNTTAIWPDDRREPRSTLGREWTICNTTQESQARLWHNKEKLLTNNLREAVSFRARMWLVVGTRLQVQHSSFRLHTSSNTPSVPTNVAHGSFHRFREGNAPSILQLLS
jgi:hypothetical protein